MAVRELRWSLWTTDYSARNTRRSLLAIFRDSVIGDERACNWHREAAISAEVASQLGH